MPSKPTPRCGAYKTATKCAAKHPPCDWVPGIGYARNRIQAREGAMGQGMGNMRNIKALDLSWKASPVKPCSKKRKASCTAPCKWTVGKGCRDGTKEAHNSKPSTKRAAPSSTTALRAALKTCEEEKRRLQVATARTALKKTFGSAKEVFHTARSQKNATTLPSPPAVNEMNEWNNSAKRPASVKKAASFGNEWNISKGKSPNVQAAAAVPLPSSNGSKKYAKTQAPSMIGRWMGYK